MIWSGAALVLTALACGLLLPLFRRYALARPNARSSHREPMPQGGGAAIVVVIAALWLASGAGGVLSIAAILPAFVLMAILGAADDLSNLSWRLRLMAQGIVIAVVLVLLPAEWRILPAMPLLIERAIALLLGLWFVNLVNFMDGIDGILVVGLVPLFLAIGTGFFGIHPVEPLGLLAAGGLLGFLMLNRPFARLFAGDVGSLSLGLLAAALLFALAARTSLVAAIILPLYFVTDATSTLLMRAVRRAVLTEAHREHAYQRAFDGGMSAWRIIVLVLTLNAALAGFATLAILHPAWGSAALVAGFAATALLCIVFRRRGGG